MVLFRIVVALMLLATALPVVQAQEPFEQCGELELVFRNKDLVRQPDGNLYAGGSLFAQFQAIGKDADKINYFGFSFGPVPTPIDDESGVCDMPAGTWFSGAYVLNYRADTNPQDGFFINLQTDLVPDGQYAAAVHAYDSGHNELARAWTNAVVKNCDAAGPVPPARCPDDPAQHAKNEKTGPWPILLPGDGDFSKAPDRPDGSTLTIEFAEELSALAFFINGKDETQNLTAWPGREWDDDLIPGYGPAGLGAVLVPECSQQPPQECSQLGEAYWWGQRAITDDDLVRVEATDVAGNSVIKELHIGSGVGGAITDDLPNLQVSVDRPVQTLNRSQTAIFKFTLVNVGGTTAHPFATATGPEGWEIRWTPAHVPTDPGATKVQELNVDIPADAVPGTYKVNATITYAKGNTEETRTFPLKINVGGAAPGAVNPNEGEGETKNEESPGFGVIALLVAAAVALAARRRQ